MIGRLQETRVVISTACHSTCGLQNPLVPLLVLGEIAVPPVVSAVSRKVPTPGTGPSCCQSSSSSSSTPTAHDVSPRPDTFTTLCWRSLEYGYTLVPARLNPEVLRRLADLQHKASNAPGFCGALSHASWMGWGQRVQADSLKSRTGSQTVHVAQQLPFAVGITVRKTIHKS